MVKIDDTSIQTPNAEATEVKPPIDDVAVRTAAATLNKYMAGKAKLDAKLIDNEDWWKLQHWRNFKQPRNVCAHRYGTLDNKTT